MATIAVVSVGQTSASVRISNLENNFNTLKYMEAGATISAFTDGQSTEPSNTKGTLDATASWESDYTPTFTISGLTAGTTYTLYGWARANNTLYYQAGNTSFTTSSAPVAPIPPNITGSSSTTSSITFYWNNPETYTYTGIIVRNLDGDEEVAWDFYSTTVTSFTASNLSSCGSYSIVLEVGNSAGLTAQSSYTAFTLCNPTISNLRDTWRTSYAIKWEWTNNDSYTDIGYDLLRVEDNATVRSGHLSGTDTSITIAGLSPLTEYRLGIEPYKAGYLVWVTDYATTSLGKYEGFSSKITGAQMEESTVEHLFFPVRASEWNDFQSFVNKVATYVGATQHSLPDVAKWNSIVGPFNNLRAYIIGTLGVSASSMPEAIAVGDTVREHFKEIQDGINTLVP